MKRLAKPCLLLVALLLAAVWLAAPALAEEGGWAYELSDDLMSPYCPGRALSQCPSPQAGELRLWIHGQEDAGRSRADVEEQLLGIYGDQLLQAPRAEGLGLVAYAIPAVCFLLGGGLVAVYLSRNRSAPASSAPVPGLDPELERRVEEELRD